MESSHRLFRLTVIAISCAIALGATDPPLGLDAYMPVPARNPLTKAKINLGRKLFFDRRLSRDNTLSCATCHDPKHGFADEKPLAVGVGGQTGTRRSPRLINRGYGRSFFWDGRAPSIENQVVQPIENPIEMDLEIDTLVNRLREDPEYSRDFRDAFENEPERDSIAMALASYVRSIVSGDSPYDRYVAGDAAALSKQQLRGLDVFRNKASCGICHLGPNLTDEQFHDTGVGQDSATPDPGRFKVTGREEDRGAFKTPTLREVAGNGPFMHDGSLATLKDVIDFYDKGGHENPNLDFDMQPLDLSDQEKADLLSFLEALSGVVREGI